MIEFIDVRKEYSDISALDEVSFRIESGEFVFIIGHSGAGKTTLTKLLLLQEKITSGSIMVNGTDITKLPERSIPYYRRTIGTVFQDFRLFKDKTAYENVAFAMRAVGTPGKEIRTRVPALLKIVSMHEKAKHFPSELSGGEQQRIALARALANNPDIIIADEPTGNVDPAMSQVIMNMLLKINQKLGKTVIVVTHDDKIINMLGQRVITIKNGRVFSDIPAAAKEADDE